MSTFSNFCDKSVQFSSQLVLHELSDLLAKIIHIPPFLLFFLLVNLINFKCCVSSGFLLHLILTLNSKRRGRIPTLELWIVERLIGMRDDTTVTLYFFIVAVVTLFLKPPNFWAVIELYKTVFKDTMEV